MLTAAQRSEFDELGLLAIRQAIPAGVANEMADRIRDFLTTEKSIERNNKMEWTREKPIGFLPLTRSGAFDAVGESRIPDVVDELYGAGGWKRPTHWGGVLMTNKVSDRPWELPTRGWHVDGPPLPVGSRPANLSVFVVLSPLRPCGGGTAILTGGYRLAAKQISETGPHRNNKTLRRQLGTRYPWLAELWSENPQPGIDRRKRYLEEGQVLDGIPVRVAEISGGPGDAFLMRSDTLHCPTPNARDEPRIMLVKTLTISP